jgi:enoyl-CoA hydratase/carnithine racemase/methionyl-tRNA formyltransferase
MKILFLCSAHNSLSQRLYLALSPSHEITVEFAISDDVMIEAAEMAKPDIIICPFMMTRVPKAIHDNYITLIIHPGPPGDAGPSSLDWTLLGDDGTIANDEPNSEKPKASRLLQALDTTCGAGRSHWGVTCLQAEEEFDKGPIWAFEQFPIDIDQRGLTKSELYRGPVTRAAVKAALAAIERIQKMAEAGKTGSFPSLFPTKYHPHLRPEPEYSNLSVSTSLPFRGGKTHSRPTLSPSDRSFDVRRHTAQQISRRIRCSDSQPGAQSDLFGPKLYLYGGMVEENVGGPNPGAIQGAAPGTIVATRNEAVCIQTRDGRGIWITHVRRLKAKASNVLHPKVPAIAGLKSIGVISDAQIERLRWDGPIDWSFSSHSTFQEVWVEFQSYGDAGRTAYLYFDFYNGAMSTDQCSHLIEAMDYIIACSTPSDPVRAVVLMGGAYFSNGIHLNVIEAAASPATESWLNINRIDDVVHYLLHEFPSRKILTIAGVRGNAAAGGVALAAACDVILCGGEVVLNPAYRAIGLHGSEYHSLSYSGRCGEAKAKELLRSMTPISPFDARAIGLVDHVIPGFGSALEKRIKSHVAVVVKSGKPSKGIWKTRTVLTPATLAAARADELNEMSKDFYSARATRYNTRRFNFVRKVKSMQTPLRFALHRRIEPNMSDEEERDNFDDVQHFEDLAEQAMLSKLIARLQQTNGETVKPEALALKLRALTPPATSPRTQPETLFSCYYKPPPETLRLPPSPVSLSSRSPSLC